MKRVNIGCGKTLIKGWENYDNSMGLLFVKFPFLFRAISKIGILNKQQSDFIVFAIQNKIKYADATKYIPESDHSVNVIYSSHMLEHLDRNEAELFFKEAHRILVNGGIIRISVPDIRVLVDNYLKNSDANSFIEATLLTNNISSSFLSKVKYLMTGNRLHKWMYDGESLSKFLLEQGFKNVRIMKAGTTMISNPGDLNLFERFEESVYVEAINYY